MIICEFALLVFAFLHTVSSSNCQWHNATEFWSNVVCSMQDIKTVNIHGVLENNRNNSSSSSRSSIFLEQYFQAFVYDCMRKCETTILSRIYTLPNSENLASFVVNNDVAHRVIKWPPSWKIISNNALPCRVTLSNNVTGKTRKIRSDKTFDRNTWNIHVIFARDVHSFGQISKDGTFEWDSHDGFIVLLTHFPEEHGLSNELNSRIDDILKTLWSKHKVQKIFVSEVIFVNDTVRIDQNIRTYNPFTRVNNSAWGRIEIIDVTAEEASDMSYLIYRRMKNMNGYTLKVGYFQRSQTNADPIKDQSSMHYSDAFKEFDERMRSTIAQRMNFHIEYVHPTDNDRFGYQLPNGTYIGAIGDLMYGRTDICMISFFVKKYSTSPKEDVDFSSYVNFDRLCVVVPKATKIPKGIRMYHFFPLSVWICLMLTHVFTYLIWHVLQIFTPGRRKRNFRITMYRSFLLNAGCPQKLPNTNAERILLSGIFLGNVTLVGIFNSILYNSFAHNMYYPDIESLRDLDFSGLPISSNNLANFLDDDDDDDDSTIIRNLRKKVQFIKSGVISTARYRNTSAFVRESHFPIISEELIDADGGPSLHLIKECLGKLYLSYLLPNNSIFNKKINTLISRLNQAGLPSLWRQNIVNDFRNKILVNRMLARNEKETDFVPFNLADVQSSFYILLIGLSISTIVFFHEKGWLKIPLLHIEKPNCKCVNH